MPIRTPIGAEYFRHDPEAQSLTGERTGITNQQWASAFWSSWQRPNRSPGGLMLELLEVDGEALPVARRWTSPGRAQAQGGKKPSSNRPNWHARARRKG